MAARKWSAADQTVYEAIAAGLRLAHANDGWVGNTGVPTEKAVTPVMTVSLSAGVFRIADTDYTSAGQDVTINTAHATLPRQDLISMGTSGTATYTVGTAAAAPSATVLYPDPPDLPASEIPVALVEVAAGVTSILDARIVDIRSEIPDHDDLANVSANDHHNQSHDHSAAGDGTGVAPATLTIPNSASPAQTAEGSAVWDSDDDVLTIGTGAARKTLVDTTATQTLSGKTLTAPTIADFTNAQHDHGDADDGGAAVSSPPTSVVARVDVAESTASSTDTGYVDLATAGPAVTITTGTKALVTVGCRAYSATGAANTHMDFAVSGATTRAATNDTSVGFIQEASASAYLLASRTSLITGLTAGSNTFTAKYRHIAGSASTSQFHLREISVINLGS